MMSLWDALRMNMMISYQELVRTFPRFMIKTNQLLLEELYRTDLTTNYFCSNIYNTSYRTGTTIKHIDEELQFHLKGYSKSENTVMEACYAVNGNKETAPIFADSKIIEIKDNVTISKI
ncbi:hypothetical protein [Enterobacter roggenkampii]|uniref:hypothetical protein n=1 Tax=Enterobacter roggenkampii TaxID=1812935 RepID=UPI0020184B8B|nr:hypothetical protein [Enterobacter roggenkampii]UQQ57740.1 hypothetical protein MUY30_10350 [Enterobacter roggenkampii]